MRAVLCRRELTESGVQKWLLSMWKACSSSRFHEKQLGYGSKSLFFGKICSDTGYNQRKAEKRSFRRGTIDEKRRKQGLVPLR